jgi:DNA-binding protein H-NS
MNVRDLERMPLDDLWNLHERIVAILDGKLVQETRKLEENLNGLNRKFGRTPADAPQSAPPQRRPYPKVPQKYCNPKYPTQTWSGRGKKPRWVKTLMAKGASLEDLRVDSAKLVQDWLKRIGR